MPQQAVEVVAVGVLLRRPLGDPRVFGGGF